MTCFFALSVVLKHVMGQLAMVELTTEAVWPFLAGIAWSL